MSNKMKVKMITMFRMKTEKRMKHKMGMSKTRMNNKMRTAEKNRRKLTTKTNKKKKTMKTMKTKQTKTKSMKRTN